MICLFADVGLMHAKFVYIHTGERSEDLTAAFVRLT